MTIKWRGRKRRKGGNRRRLLRHIRNDETYMVSTGTERKSRELSICQGMPNVLDNGRLNCLRHLPPTTEVRIGMHRIRIRIHMTSDSNSSSQIWAYLGDGGGRHGVVGVFGLSMGSRLLVMEVIPMIYYGNGRNWYEMSENMETMMMERVCFPKYVHGCA